MNCADFAGGQIGHRKYDCPEQRNFTANIICRVCGNAGHMARDCPDRQRGSDMRNQLPGNQGPPRARIGAGDAVDREMEVSSVPFQRVRAVLTHVQNLMQELSGNPSSAPAGRLEAAPGGYDQGGDSYGGESRPWARPQAAGGAGGAAPWARENRQESYGDRNGGGGAAPWAQQSRPQENYGGYGAPPGSNAAPWQQAPPPPGGNYGGYGGYSGYDQGGYAPPAPPGLSDMLQQYSQQQAPPPPPGDNPPPPPDWNAPPPPPGDAAPPPPPA